MSIAEARKEATKMYGTKDCPKSKSKSKSKSKGKKKKGGSKGKKSKK